MKEGSSRVEAVSYTSTVTLRVVGDYENVNIKSEAVKYGHESHWIRAQKWLRWPGPEAIVKDRTVLSSEKASHMNKPATVWQ
jgi:hypothetical protein